MSIDFLPVPALIILWLLFCLVLVNEWSMIVSYNCILIEASVRPGGQEVEGLQWYHPYYIIIYSFI